MRTLLFSIILFCVSANLPAESLKIQRNQPEREQWFQSLGFGMFIHWSVDVQIGGIISHNVAAASKSYQQKYFEDLPRFFNPKSFDPGEWAKLARLAGMKYMVFTAKHHNGFCMWDTETVDFNIMNTPYGKDIMREIIDAFRAEGIAIGLYFSPDDFYLNYQQGIPPSRDLPEANPDQNKKMWDIEKQQIKELLTRYGKIDIFFIDEYVDYANTLVADYCWDVQPDLVITRGGMQTPEQTLPDQPLPGPWEACFTIGRHWGYVADDTVKSGSTLINMLIETRAKGGNLLLNVSPDSHGRIPAMQEARLREMAFWMMANEEAIEATMPFDVIKEKMSANYWHGKPDQFYWFTQSNDGKAVYVFVPAENWGVNSYRTFFIKSLQGSEETDISVLGQNNEAMEYEITVSPKPIWSVVKQGIFVHAIRSQRTNRYWHNPVVLKFRNVRFNHQP